MRATGIVRRIDDLGRVVIPKEIRRTMNIKEGDPLEIYIDGKFVCFKRYMVERDWDTAHKVANSMFLSELLPGEYNFALYDENFERKTATNNMFEADGSTIDSSFIHAIPDNLGWIAVDFDDRTDTVDTIANANYHILAKGE